MPGQLLYSIAEGPAAGQLAVSPDLARINVNMSPGPGDEDALLAVWTRAAVRLAEAESRLRITPRTLTIRFEDFPPSGEPLVFPVAPIRAVGDLLYTPAAADPAEEETYDPADYFAWLDYDPPHLWPAGDALVWPVSAARSFVSVTVDVGYADPELIPDGIRGAILALVGFFEKHREFVARDGTGAVIPPAFRSLVFTGMRGGLY